MIDSKWVSVLNADSEAVIRFFKHALVCFVFFAKDDFMFLDFVSFFSFNVIQMCQC